METTPTTDIRYQQARKRVEEIKGFYTHLVIYLVVNAFLFAIDLIDGGNWWFYWPLLGWGIAVAIHGAVTFGVEGPFGKRWEERKLRELMEDDHQLHGV
ncbi:MAG TPA: 2TM domain-containing protein [Thermomicrobiales bacterium]|nr:2TM domain-containing protein [Thermomicrobiales bacterium]